MKFVVDARLPKRPEVMELHLAGLGVHPAQKIWG